MACAVIPGLYGLAVQGVLLLASIGALLLKWYLEKLREEHPRRFFVFVMDGSKQLAGAGWIHVLNLAFAEVLAARIGQGDQCEWYWINIMVDTTLGSAVEYCILHVANCLIRNLCRCLSPEAASDWVESGDYFDKQQNLRLARYAKQLFVWLVVVVSGMKAAMVCLMVTLNAPLRNAADLALHPFAANPKIKLIVVMIATPSVMNAFQFWVVDGIIRWRGPAGKRGARLDVLEQEVRDLRAVLGRLEYHMEPLLDLPSRVQQLEDDFLMAGLRQDVPSQYFGSGCLGRV